ncbi:MAG: hypothetical protein GF416_05445 [Candidatus Altiarchaeales archaeon]|nr:hypothetical protein [Candidatus Altiarchaeales archaeon]MBD3416562.1 hypothetical protein [Candidatus Altiarchaeales archaeon]
MRYYSKACSRGLLGGGIENMVLLALILVASWVILGVVLPRLGILEPPTSERGYVGFSGIIPEHERLGWLIDNENDRGFFVFRNIGDSTATIRPGSVEVTIGQLKCDPAPADEPLYVKPGDKALVEVRCPELNERFSRIGQYYEAYVNIVYETPAGIRHNSSGILYGHIERTDPRFEPPNPSITGTTQPRIPQCFYHECNVSGGMDYWNCGDLLSQFECLYCPQEPDPVDGKHKCWYTGTCGMECNSDKECDQFTTDPYLLQLNKCTKCSEDPNSPIDDPRFICQEVPGVITCGPCPPYDAGSLDSAWCDYEGCRYCYYEWVQLSELPDDGVMRYRCVEQGNCGDSCIDYGFDVYQECQERCVFCEPNEETPDPTDGTCDQGSCGEHCGLTGLDECDEGCMWCNNTGPNPSYTCEMGDCGKDCDPTNPIDECQLGCDICYGPNLFGEYKCVKMDIAAAINANNGTAFGNVVRPNDPIYVDLEGECEDGIDKLLVSNSISNDPATEPPIDCQAIADQINSDLGEIDDPLSTEVKDYLQNTWGITWMSAPHQCGGVRICKHRWETSEADINRYCYFGIAQKFSSSGDGRWSRIVGDDIIVGYIDVYLAYPKAEGYVQPQF